MRGAPVTDAPRFPLTVGTALVALGVSLAYWSDGDVGVLLMEPTAFRDEPWRLVTAILPHGDVLHLVFNLYWLWVFGSFVERAFGHATMAGLIVLLAAVPSSAQFAVSGGGIGLSGVGYGLLGFLCMTARYDRRFRDAMDARTLQLFLAWGLLCIVLTAAGVWRIANTAHAVGLLGGLAIGAARAWQGKHRWATVGGIVLGCGLVLAAATVLRPTVSFFDRDASGHCYQGYVALEQRDDQRALWLLERAAEHPKVSAGCLLNYGIALERNGRREEAAIVYARAEAADPDLAAGQRAPAHDVE